MAKTASKKTEETREEKLNRYEQPTEHFYWLGLVNNKKPPRSVEEVDSHYPPFMVNKGLSYYKDTIGYVNLMNQNSHLANKIQFDFLQKVIPRGKRFEKWIKPEKEELISQIQELYKVSRAVAKEYVEIINVMSDSESIINDINMRLFRGGRY